MSDVTFKSEQQLAALCSGESRYPLRFCSAASETHYNVAKIGPSNCNYVAGMWTPGGILGREREKTLECCRSNQHKTVKKAYDNLDFKSFVCRWHREGDKQRIFRSFGQRFIQIISVGSFWKVTSEAPLGTESLQMPLSG